MRCGRHRRRTARTPILSPHTAFSLSFSLSNTCNHITCGFATSCVRARSIYLYIHILYTRICVCNTCIACTLHTLSAAPHVRSSPRSLKYPTNVWRDLNVRFSDTYTHTHLHIHSELAPSPLTLIRVAILVEISGVRRGVNARAGLLSRVKCARKPPTSTPPECRRCRCGPNRHDEKGLNIFAYGIQIIRTRIHLSRHTQTYIRTRARLTLSPRACARHRDEHNFGPITIAAALQARAPEKKHEAIAAECVKLFGDS